MTDDDGNTQNTEHHTLTLEWADYSHGSGEVTAAFCSCGDWSWAISPPSRGFDDIDAAASGFTLHVDQPRRSS